MHLANHKLIWVFACAAIVGGCASPWSQRGREDRDGRRPDGFERLIHVDADGNVSRGAVEQRPSEIAAPQAASTRREPPAAAKIESYEPEVVPSDESLSEQSRKFHENLAAKRQDVAKPALSTAPEIPPGVQPTVVRSKRFTLEYDDQLLGPDGIAKVELYGTRDNGRTWQRLGEDSDRKSPYDIQLDDEGLYGFRIAVAGKNGLASRAPKDGELPELWVKVDSNTPAFRGKLKASDAEVVVAEAEVVVDDDAPPQPKVVEGTKIADEQAGHVATVSHAEEIKAVVDWRTHLTQAIAAIEDELAGRDADSDQPEPMTPLTDEQKSQLGAQLRLLYMAAGKHDAAIRSSQHHSTGENEFWSHQMHSIHLLLAGDDKLPPARRSAAALAELRQASDKLAAISELQISSLTFCTAAHSFGVFETSIDGERWKHNDYRQAKFEPEQPVVLYFEVHNYTSEQHTSREYPDGAWRTSLKGTYTILDHSGRPLQRREMKLRDDICRNRRHDYFVAYKTWMPQLNPGQYTLELLIEDAIAGKIGTSTIDFEIVGR